MARQNLWTRPAVGVDVCADKEMHRADSRGPQQKNQGRTKVEIPKSVYLGICHHLLVFCLLLILGKFLDVRLDGVSLEDREGLVLAHKRDRCIARCELLLRCSLERVERVHNQIVQGEI